MDEDNIFTTGELAYFNDKATFFAGIDGDVTGNVTGDLEGNIFAPGLCIFENGPVIIGGLEDTDTPGQVLQIYGGGYFEGALGIGTTNVAGIGSTSTLFGVFGDTTVTGYQYRGSRIKTASLTIRGSGLNQSNVDRFVALNSEILVDGFAPGIGRGLALTIIGAGLTHISTINYDTYYDTVDSDALATAISGISTGQIGVLSSCDAWEASVTDNLRFAARRVGLSKLGYLNKGFGDIRRPYAAVFSGIASNSNSSPHDVIERMESSNSNAPYASIFCTLASDEVGVSIHGATSTNVLYSADSNIEDPVILVDSNSNVGVGTSIPRSKLDVIGDTLISGSVGIGTSIPTSKLNVNGTVTATTFVGNGITPLGGIIMWSGTIAEASLLEPGWALCDGRIVNGKTTPDLRNRFIVGASTETASGNYIWDPATGLASGNYGVNNVGGETSHQLTVSEMPLHDHKLFSTAGADPNGTIVGTRSAAQLKDTDGDGSYIIYSTTSDGEPNYFRSSGTGGNAYHENRPPYFALAFIMRTS